MASDTAAKTYLLRSSDGEAFEVSEAVAKESQTIKRIIEDGCADAAIPVHNVTGNILAKVIKHCKRIIGCCKPITEDGYADAAIPVHNVTGKILAKVIEYCKRHVDTSDKSDGDAGDGSNKPVDEELKKFDIEFVRVDRATLFGLIYFHCLKKDFTPEEEEKVRRENAWAFE